MKRLTEYIGKDSDKPHAVPLMSDPKIGVQDCLNKLAEYEDLEEQGRLIKLLCKVGDKIYTINFPFVIEHEIQKVSVTYETSMETINEWEIGQYAYFTREEAEAALEGDFK